MMYAEDSRREEDSEGGSQDDDDEDSEDDWYPGKMLGLPKPREGEWYPGKIFMEKQKRGEMDVDLLSQLYPLKWHDVAELTAAVSRTDDVEAVLAALDICINVVSDDITLTTATFTALSRVGKGRVEKMVLLGKGGACEQVVKLLHFFNYSSFGSVNRSTSTPQQDLCDTSLQACLVSAVVAIEGLSAGCKKNRSRLARAGACFYLVETLRRHCLAGGNVPLLEAILNAIWQLSFSNKLSKKCFRDCGIENDLWQISENGQFFSELIRRRASSVLRWLKTQLVDDIHEIFDPATISGALLLSVLDISLTAVKGNTADAVKVASEGLVGLENVLMCRGGYTCSVMQSCIECLHLPATVVSVTRRLLRFYKKIFHENNDGLYKFIIIACSTISCFLSKSYRIERRRVRTEEQVELEERLVRIESLLPAAAVEVEEGGGDRESKLYAYDRTSDAIVLAATSLEKEISALEHKLTAAALRQMKETSVCKLLVKTLVLFVKEDVQVAAPKKSGKTTSLSVSSNPIDFLNSAADTFTRGLISGLQEVHAGLSKLGESNARNDAMDDVSMIPFPESSDGECVNKICECMRLLSKMSLFTRLQFFEEGICDVFNRLLLGNYASKIEVLYLSYLSKVKKDFHKMKSSLDSVDVISDYQAVILIFALKVLTTGGDKMLSSRSKKVTSSVIELLCASLDVIASIVSGFGILGDRLLREYDGYELVFACANSKFLSSYRLAESWLNMCTNIALARIESKEVLGRYGACDVCMNILRMHSLRPTIVQCSLWAICVLIGNHPANVQRLLSWRSDNWTEDSVKKFLETIKKNKGQTSEARDNASLICSAISIYEAHQLVSKESSLTSENQDESLKNVCDFVPLKTSVPDASEYIAMYRSSNSTIAGPSFSYNSSSFMELNAEPFYRFTIIGSHNISAGSTIDLNCITAV